MTHYLKIDPFYLNRLIDGNKTFEVRKNDRDFQEGDILILREWHNSKYLEREVTAEITYVLRKFEGLKEGYVVLGIKVLNREEKVIEEEGIAPYCPQCGVKLDWNELNKRNSWKEGLLGKFNKRY